MFRSLVADRRKAGRPGAICTDNGVDLGMCRNPNPSRLRYGKGPDASKHLIRMTSPPMGRGVAASAPGFTLCREKRSMECQMNFWPAKCTTPNWAGGRLSASVPQAHDAPHRALPVRGIVATDRPQLEDVAGPSAVAPPSSAQSWPNSSLRAGSDSTSEVSPAVVVSGDSGLSFPWSGGDISEDFLLFTGCISLLLCHLPMPAGLCRPTHVAIV